MSASSSLNLPWEAAVLDYRERLAAMTVHSATCLVFEQPLHRRPIDRWKNYARWLEPGRVTLDRFVMDFGCA